MDLPHKYESGQLHVAIDNGDIHSMYLCIELTQMCNLLCKHCLRGEPNEVYITRDIINHFFDGIRNFNEVGIMGGENHLHIQGLEYLYDALTKAVKKIPNGRFHSLCLWDNGTKIDHDMFRLLEKIADLCNSVLLQFSHDKFHDLSLIEAGYDPEKIQENFEMAKLKYPKIQMVRTYNHYRGGNKISRMGRAKTLIDPNEIFYSLELPEEGNLPPIEFQRMSDLNNYTTRELNLCATGTLTGDYAYDYGTQEKLSYGNISKSSFQDVLKNCAREV